MFRSCHSRAIASNVLRAAGSVRELGELLDNTGVAVVSQGGLGCVTGRAGINEAHSVTGPMLRSFSLPP
jgi:hypothetical protein